MPGPLWSSHSGPSPPLVLPGAPRTQCPRSHQERTPGSGISVDDARPQPPAAGSGTGAPAAWGGAGDGDKPELTCAPGSAGLPEPPRKLLSPASRQSHITTFLSQSFRGESPFPQTKSPLLCQRFTSQLAVFPSTRPPKCWPLQLPHTSLCSHLPPTRSSARLPSLSLPHSDHPDPSLSLLFPGPAPPACSTASPPPNRPPATIHLPTTHPLTPFSPAHFINPSSGSSEHLAGSIVKSMEDPDVKKKHSSPLRSSVSGSARKANQEFTLGMSKPDC